MLKVHLLDHLNAMALLQLDTPLLYLAVKNACKNVIAHRNQLNAINIFPVADGDTGDNMASTAKAILDYAQEEPLLTPQLKSIANASIMGARGNSGMIFSQFFNGLLETDLGVDSLPICGFCQLIDKACHSVRQAILKPVEGTILTVMEAWAKSLQRHSEHELCFIKVLNASLDDVQTALAATTNSLDVLQAAHVVDAGALGFSVFIEGFTQYLTQPQPLEMNEEWSIAAPPKHETPTIGQPPLQRYCTEAVVSAVHLNKEEITKRLQDFGDSIVLTANQQLCRLHIHCNEPARVFEHLKLHGCIQYPKVEDMLRQYEVVHARRYPIALMTDSSVNLPQTIIDDYQIHLISINVHCDGHDFLDRHCFDPLNFYQTLNASKSYPKTSSPSPALIADRLTPLTPHFGEILILTVSQALSSTYDAFIKAASKLNNVHVLDSRHVSGSQGLLLYHAAELIHQGLSISDIKIALTEKIAKTHLFVMVDQFDAMIRSGRVNRLKGRFAQFSGIKPIISFDENGKGCVIDKAYGERKALIKLIDIVTQLLDKAELDNYCIVHAGAAEKAQDFAQMTTEAFGREPLFIEPVSTVIGLHAGQGSIAIGVSLL